MNQNKLRIDFYNVLSNWNDQLDYDDPNKKSEEFLDTQADELATKICDIWKGHN